MTPTDIAEARSLTVEDPTSFLLAFNAGRRAAEMDVDTAVFLRSLCIADRPSEAAGFIEGMAATNAEAGMPTKPDARRRTVLHGSAGAR